MAGSVTLFPRFKAKLTTQRLTCRNAIFIAIAFIVFEVGFMIGQVGMGTVARGLFYPNLNNSEFANIDDSPISVRQFDSVVSGFNNALPLSLRRISPLTRDSPDAEFHRNHRFSQPLVLQAYVRYKAGVNDAMEIVLITTGVSMGTFARNFSAAGCMIADNVYPVNSFLHDRALCTIPRGIAKGAPITLVIFKDDVVETALRGPVTIEKEFVAQLEDGDLNELKEGVKLHGGLAMHDLGDLMTVRSHLVYEGQFDPYSTDDYKVIPRYEVCLGTQIKPSTHLLPDWLDYHRRLGVDFVYIFDNHAREDVSKLLEHRRDVEVVYWPWEKSQIQAFTYAAYAMRARCEWLLLMDSDEYVMLGLDGPDKLSKRELPPLKRYVRDKEQEGYGQVWFHWVIMKNSGYVTLPHKPIPEAYIHMEDPQLKDGQPVTLGKTMTSMDLEWIISTPHSRRAEIPEKVFDDYYAGLYPERISDTGMIVHYRRRSWVEYREKMKVGRANINNPMPMSSLKLWDEKSREGYKEKYMEFSLRDRKRYTHFRDIWRRVTGELGVGKCVTARFVDGRRCRTVYNFSRTRFAEPLREMC